MILFKTFLDLVQMGLALTIFFFGIRHAMVKDLDRRASAGIVIVISAVLEVCVSIANHKMHQ